MINIAKKYCNVYMPYEMWDLIEKKYNAAKLQDHRKFVKRLCLIELENTVAKCEFSEIWQYGMFTVECYFFEAKETGIHTFDVPKYILRKEFYKQCSNCFNIFLIWSRMCQFNTPELCFNCRINEMFLCRIIET